MRRVGVITATLAPFLLLVSQGKTILDYLTGLGKSVGTQYSSTGFARSKIVKAAISRYYPNVKSCDLKWSPIAPLSGNESPSFLVQFKECFSDTGTLDEYRNAHQGASTPISPWIAVILSLDEGEYKVTAEYGLAEGPYQKFQAAGPFLIRQTYPADW